MQSNKTENEAVTIMNIGSSNNIGAIIRSRNYR